MQSDAEYIPTGWIRFEGITLDVYGEPWMTDVAVKFWSMPNNSAICTVLLDRIVAISRHHR